MCKVKFQVTVTTWIRCELRHLCDVLVGLFSVIKYIFIGRNCCAVNWRNLYKILPARRYASAGNSDRNVSVCLSVCPSVCPSVTRRYCVKTKKASGMISSPSGSPKTLVYWRQIFAPNSKGYTRKGASNKGRSEKFSDFLALSVNISKTVADTAKVTISH